MGALRLPIPEPKNGTALMVGQKRVLVVDDSPDNLSSLCELLAIWGYDADAADDGPRALLALARRRPDVVVMDVGLPDRDGLDVIRRIKATDGDITVIAFSGWHHFEAVARAAGADGFVLKPDVEALERLLAYRRAPAAQRGSGVAKKAG